MLTHGGSASHIFYQMCIAYSSILSLKVYEPIFQENVWVGNIGQRFEVQWFGAGPDRR